MRTVFDKSTREELIIRISSLSENCKPLWGKMNMHQMVRHCTIWNSWVLGADNFVYKQDFLGKLFGPMALRVNTKDDRPLSKGMPAGKAFIVKDAGGDLRMQQAIWKVQVNEYEKFSNADFVHDFFGKMTKEQIGIFAYKHNDHHLRQFNA